MKPLDKLQAIVDATTPGPWFLADNGAIRAKNRIPFGIENLDKRFEGYKPWCAFVDDNAETGKFIIAARNVMPALIEVIRLLYTVKGCRVEMAGGKEWLHIPMFYLDEIKDALAALDKAIEGT